MSSPIGGWQRGKASAEAPGVQVGTGIAIGGSITTGSDGLDWLQAAASLSSASKTTNRARGVTAKAKQNSIRAIDRQCPRFRGHCARSPGTTLPAPNIDWGVTPNWDR